MKKTKRAGLITKLVVLAVLIVVSISLLNLRGRLSDAQSNREQLKAQVDTQIQHNAALQDDIDHSDDPDTVLEVAKDKLGLVNSEEVIIYDTTN